MLTSCDTALFKTSGVRCGAGVLGTAWMHGGPVQDSPLVGVWCPTRKARLTGRATEVLQGVFAY